MLVSLFKGYRVHSYVPLVKLTKTLQDHSKKGTSNLVRGFEQSAAMVRMCAETQRKLCWVACRTQGITIC